MKKLVKCIIPEHMNYVVYAMAMVLIVCGLVFMGGEGTDNNAFRPEIFSVLRIRTAPLLCLAGYLLVVVGIMWPGKRDATEKSS